MNAGRLIVGLILSSLFALVAAAAEPSKPVPVAAASENGAFKQLLGELWNRLRSYGPRAEPTRADGRQASVTIGIRGSEQTESELKLYWKDDRASDPSVAEENKAFQTAQELADTGRLREAEQAFDGFLKRYPSSPLKPNAQFGLGLSRIALGDAAQARTTFTTFVAEYPRHPLAEDANRALAQLGKL